MEVHKKRNHTVNPAPYIKVKKEKSDIERIPQPMSFYIDDRLELMKQIFGSLKPKTILNLAPDFLKVKTLEEIEEACLHELLCMSSKRLKSIITAIKCPTDTESSDEDSDVQCREEHISLEEISSDSEIEGTKFKKGKKKKTTNNSTAESGVKINNIKSNESDSECQVSVLELLELQARARAIRSQLALEPITKIEVDSDDEKQKHNNNAANKDHVESNKSNKRNTVELKPIRQHTTQPANLGDVASAPIQTNDSSSNHLVKKVKLKRNYRRPSASLSENQLDSNSEKVSLSGSINDDANVSTKLISGKICEKNVQIKEEQHLTRSPSPDVIPIILEPETLLVSDSSEGGESGNTRNMGVTEIIQGGNDDGIVAKGNPKDVSQQENATNDNETKKVDSEPEDGEVIEDDDEDEATNGCMDVRRNESEDSKDSKDSKDVEDNIVEIEDVPADSSTAIQMETVNSCVTETPIISSKNQEEDSKVKDDVTVTVTATVEKFEKSEKSEQLTALEEDDDQNDDVISLEGGDLESEMIEHLQNDTGNNNTNKSFEELDTHIYVQKSHDVSQADDVISLESSEEEPTINVESWQSRYMKSSKISKVLATSRLGKRVRDKIKKSKASSISAAEEKSEREVEKQESLFTSKHEDGSVEQYKELLEICQRKI